MAFEWRSTVFMKFHKMRGLFQRTNSLCSNKKTENVESCFFFDRRQSSVSERPPRFFKQQIWEEGLREYLPWLKAGSGIFKGGGAWVVVHKISDALCGVLHLPARGQGVLLDHPATGRGQWARSQLQGPRPGDETNTPGPLSCGSK